MEWFRKHDSEPRKAIDEAKRLSHEGPGIRREVVFSVKAFDVLKQVCRMHGLNNHSAIQYLIMSHPEARASEAFKNPHWEPTPMGSKENTRRGYSSSSKEDR